MERMESGSVLRGRRILVVEDEYMLAEEAVEALDRAGAEIVGPTADLGEALRLAEGHQRLDGALLDVNLRGRMVWPLADALMARGIPMVLTTGYGTGTIPPGYALLPHCEKPSLGDDLAFAMARVVRPR